MKMIDVTNSHYNLVSNQLENTDAFKVKVYSLGSSTVIYTEANTHKNLIVLNRSRTVRDQEVNFAISKLLEQDNRHKLEVLKGHNFVQIEKIIR